MNLYEAITERKSTRTFIQEPLADEVLEKLLASLQSFPLLDENVILRFRFVRETKGLFNVIAPHYLIITGYGKKDEQVNAGFIGEQFVLYLHTQNIGAVWQGKSKEKGKGHSKHDIIVIAFGKTKAPLTRELTDFKRKEINEMTNYPDDECLKSVQLAPSGLNLQPWFFEKKKNKLIVYEQTLKPPLSLLYKTTAVDLGIALSHYAIACSYFKKPFSFKQLTGKSNKKGYKIFGEITLNE